MGRHIHARVLRSEKGCRIRVTHLHACSDCVYTRNDTVRLNYASRFVRVIYSSRIVSIKLGTVTSLGTFSIQLKHPIFLVASSFPSCCKRSGLPMQVRDTECVLQSTQFLTETCGNGHRCAIFPKWFCTHHARIGEFSATCPWLCSTFVAVRKLHIWHHGVGSF